MSLLAWVLFVTLAYCGWEFFLAEVYELSCFALLGAFGIVLWVP